MLCINKRLYRTDRCTGRKQCDGAHGGYRSGRNHRPHGSIGRHGGDGPHRRGGTCGSHRACGRYGTSRSYRPYRSHGSHGAGGGNRRHWPCGPDGSGGGNGSHRSGR